MFGGTCGISMNPARMFGPAIFSGEWYGFYVYSIAELCGAGAASLMVHRMHRFRQELSG